MSQLSMFDAEDAAPALPAADPDRVRRKLEALLAEARNAGTFGLPDNRRRFIEVVVPQMTRWLPDDEAHRLKDAFQQALAA
jgi:hypothetical protein